MADEEMIRSQELYELYDSGEIQAFGDSLMIEDAALEIERLDKRIAWLKDYKKKKTEAIDTEAKKTQAKIDFFKEVILETLTSIGEKKMNFPGSCNVSTRKNPVNWDIQDEEEFIRLRSYVAFRKEYAKKT